MDYFTGYPKISYNGLSTVDMSVRFTLVEQLLKNHTSYYNYYWQDGDRLDIIAEKYYGDSRLAWLVMLSSSIFDWIYDLPLSNNEFFEYLERKYPGYIADSLRTTVHSYHDVSGTTIDKDTYEGLPELHRSTTSVYQYEYDLNESKRNIKLISKALVPDITKELETRLQQIKNNRRLSEYDTRN